MSGVTGQAAGLAVGAAVGSIIPGVGTAAGAAVGAGVGSLITSLSTSDTQHHVDTAALQLNLEQHRTQAAEKSAIHAQNFRRALASQIAISSMRGGSGSITRQFASQAYSTFLDDQRAIELGLSVTEAQGGLSQADINARRDARNTTAFGKVISAFDGINLNKVRGQ